MLVPRDDLALDEMVELAREAASAKDRTLLGSPFYQRVVVLEQQQGSRARADLLREILSQLAKDQRGRIDDLTYPQTVRDLIHAAFERIDDQIGNPSEDYFDLSRQATRCDFRMVCFSRIPAGVEHFELSGIPRKLSVSGGVSQGVRFLRMLRRTGGRRPLYEMHVAHHISDMAFFRAYNPEARAATYRNVAQCLEMNPQIRGLMAGSWWFDPQARRVSPRLPDFGELMLDHGAFLFRYERDSSALKNALANSPARQRLYDKGQYAPTTYIVIWPRDALIAWARQRGTRP
ncbi:MAG: hypothetical protein JXB62_11000 [Pirellulales bacterium]|nr:hypothetical protein [Pirellulales bacterium]